MKTNHFAKITAQELIILQLIETNPCFEFLAVGT